ncbi:prolipoprotein diacylglyceryl transferase [Maribacter sp. R77961]|jgi:prolipoprotein diacylglyceryl transferase|uniref:prolipoprotein diacylglyceryl transferase n=1 Tax=Maribacter sp. R77961 TaxID=3093871 RepID=UPI0037C89F70
MHFLGITWNPNETLFNIGFVQIKYYNLSWIIAFALGWYIMKKIFVREKKSVEQLDSLFIHTVLGTMLGARLGHVFFYDWPYYKNHLLEILLPIRESNAGSLFFGLIDGYEFTGFTGLASHGAIIGVFVAVYIFTRKFPEFSMLWLLDRMVVPFGMIAFIRFGNFFNSEINGKIVDENFIFATRFIRDSDDLHPSKALAITKEKTLDAAYNAIENNPQFSQYLAEIPYRHPAQVYEGVAYIFIFIILYFLYWKTDKRNKLGYLFGLFLVLLWTIRFFVEFVKKSQGGFEESLGLLSTGQWLSIPFIFIGLFFMFKPSKKG